MARRGRGAAARAARRYNTILWLWLVGGVGSALFETRPAHRKWVALGAATAPALLASARHHFSWAREQARREPELWSPALLDLPGP